MIVSDSTALIALIAIDEFSLLKCFTEKIIIPQEVYKEVTAKEDAKHFLDQEIEAKFVEVADCDNRLLFDELRILLDRGEAAAIVLAIEKSLPLLIDEKKGRSVAQTMGVEIVGLVGAIRFLYRNETLSREQTEQLLEKLNASSFRVTRELTEMVLSYKPRKRRL